MATSKRFKLLKSLVSKTETYDALKAIDILKDNSKVNFVESIDVAINLGVDPRKSDQAVRGATVLPRGTGKVVRVAVFAQGASADAALSAGADLVGMDELALQIKGGEINFDVVIAAPDTMRIVGQLGQILGPRGLMPNPKVGTVTADVATAVRNAKSGQVRYRTDKKGIIHCTIGKVTFETAHLKENLEALLIDLKKLKPATSKGIYVKKLTLSSTMGPGLTVDVSSLST